ncbi:putative RNA-binding protein with PIN domain [Natronobacillus azotifigens]|uniref:NYN domain-containing protein n=1 Tax=Natronobacillus azotifigens TaxID=472978 RepID=A0A9J6RD70_9BACI|nr:NYN domain-containing protein [Natronobacillus azotifigens]MCZ0703495.1 NYN domain-containing protein [Natronobacillus azotifigens]
MDVLLVDGYNIIGDWEELKGLKDKDLAQARQQLIEKMAEYQAYRGYRVIVVFDAYEVRGTETKQKQYKIEVIYTKEQETADQCIERLVKELKNIKTKVYVATSDYTEQRTIFQQGAYRKSARELQVEVNNIQAEINEELEIFKAQQATSKIPLKQDVLEVFEKWRRGNK